jgi:UDP-N-acetylglucosamine 3-dehydrogenase
MRNVDVAVIGTGPDPDDSREEKGYSMGYRHANAYESVEGCTLVGCSDIVGENAADFAANFDIPAANGFEDHRAMLDAVDPDLVSICTPPKTHLSLVTDCAEHDSVRGIHCEKPLAPTWKECTQMVEVCEEQGVQLTFNFQNRGRPAVQTISGLLADGAIGDLQRVEVVRADLMQTGIHNIDLANYFAGEADVEWVMGQADAHAEDVWYTDMHVESQGVGWWGYENGVQALAFSGDHADDLSDAHLRLRGSEGAVELEFWSDDPVRVRSDGEAGWRSCAVGEGSGQQATLADVVGALRDGRTPLVSAERGLRATEIVFAIWESAKRRGRVDLPLENDGNALDDVIADH